jgi:hypothetical protein
MNVQWNDGGAPLIHSSGGSPSGGAVRDRREASDAVAELPAYQWQPGSIRLDLVPACSTGANTLGATRLLEAGHFAGHIGLVQLRVGGN